MVEREVRSSQDIVDFIYQVKNNINLRLIELAEISGVSKETINCWKGNKRTPSVNSVIKVLTVLDIEIVLSIDKMEEKVLTKDDILNFIYQVKENKKLEFSEIYKKAGVCKNAITTWKSRNVNFSIDTAIKVLSALDTKILLRYDQSDEVGKEVNLEIDDIVFVLARRALGRCTSFSEKLRLCKVLESF